MDICKQPTKRELYHLLIDKQIELLKADFGKLWEIKSMLCDEIEIILDADYNKIKGKEIGSAINKINRYMKDFAVNKEV